MGQTQGRIGFTCAYTPLPIIDAAVFTPFRLLPMGNWPDQAGRILHDNMCPHVKRVLDRAMTGDLPPDLAGVVFVNSCDAMRRTADAWEKLRPSDRVARIDLPVMADPSSVSYFAVQLRNFASVLSEWGGSPVTAEAINSGIDKFNALAALLREVELSARGKRLSGGRPRMQALYNRASTEDAETMIGILREVIGETPPAQQALSNAVPVFLFGNMLPDPAAYGMFESCGVHIAADDFCTGSRLFAPVENDPSGDVFNRLAQQLFSHPPCARTVFPAQPAKIAGDIVMRVRECGAAGAIGHIMKFCDPYLARMPLVRKAFKEAGLPLLILEGDCTLGSIGQQRTRIEAFIEMLR